MPNIRCFQSRVDSAVPLLAERLPGSRRSALSHSSPGVGVCFGIRVISRVGRTLSEVNLKIPVT